MRRIAKLAGVLSIAALGSGCFYPIEAGDMLDARLSLTWTIEDPSTRAAITCDAVGADLVLVASDNVETGYGFTDTFPCVAGHGSTAPLEAGDYAVTVDLASCHGPTSCASPYVYSSTRIPGVVGVWDDGRYLLGEVVFHPLLPAVK